MKIVEGLRKQNPNKWFTVVDGDEKIDGGLYINQDATLVLEDVTGNSEEFIFTAGQFVPMDISVVVSGATGNNVRGLRK